MSLAPKSPPNSPPETPSTPSKQPTAAEKQKRLSRTPLTNGASRVSRSGVVVLESEHVENPENVIQVPSTAPLASEGDSPTDKAKESQSKAQAPVQTENGHTQNGHLRSRNSQEHQEHSREKPSENASGMDTSDLAPFDWEDFRRRYTKDITKINEEEEELYTEFDRLTTAFSTWAEVAANRDNQRASKRLRTRERYVQLAEEALEEKKQRYVQVVGAFKQALEMLRSNGI